MPGAGSSGLGRARRPKHVRESVAGRRWRAAQPASPDSDVRIPLVLLGIGLQDAAVAITQNPWPRTQPESLLSGSNARIVVPAAHVVAGDVGSRRDKGVAGGGALGDLPLALGHVVLEGILGQVGELPSGCEISLGVRWRRHRGETRGAGVCSRGSSGSQLQSADKSSFGLFGTARTEAARATVRAQHRGMPHRPQPSALLALTAVRLALHPRGFEVHRLQGHVLAGALPHSRRQRQLFLPVAAGVVKGIRRGDDTARSAARCAPLFLRQAERS